MRKLIWTMSILIFVSMVFSACNSKQKQEKEADVRLIRISKLIDNNDFAQAKLQIDSIHLLFPRFVAKRKIAVALLDTIVRRESAASLAMDTLTLCTLQDAIDSLKRNFRFEKDAKYDEYGKYVYKTQIAEQNTGRNYLKCSVDEKGNLILQSIYTGSKLNHYALIANVDDVFVSTDTLKKDNAVLHTFSDGVNYYENLYFETKADSNLVAFMATNYAKPIKITLIGNKKFSYWLASQDKNAIAETFNFHKLFSVLIKTQHDILVAKQRIGKIKLLYN